MILHNIIKRKYCNIGGTCQHSIGKVLFRNTPRIKSEHYLETSLTNQTRFLFILHYNLTEETCQFDYVLKGIMPKAK